MATKKRASGVATRLVIKGGPKYRIEISWSEEDQCYVARVPELPGCMTDGETYTAVAENVEQAIQSYVGTLMAEGKPVPVPVAERSFSGKIPLRIDPRLHRDLVMKADLEDLSLNEFLATRLEKVK
jgi:predicted RNase H-like HicB family nuclease